MSGQHRGPVAPILYRIRCWIWGHDIEQTGFKRWHCTRCDRIARTPVELP